MFRWFALGVLLACFTISTLYRRRARVEGGTIPRSREAALLVAARLIVALPLWLAIVAYVVNPAWMRWSSFVSPTWVQWVGVSLGLACVPVTDWVFSSIGRNVSETVLTKERHELVTHGPYRWIRHPLYSMGVALIAAIGLMAANWFILSFAVVVTLAIRAAIIPREEHALVAVFGDRYRDYKRGTGAMLPRRWVRR
jgi:protein-S-isoprenylcysteine O-methyltransferase Ste14